jgi:hypothetical protein
MISDNHISVTLSVMGLIITIALVGIVLTNSTGPLLLSSSKTAQSPSPRTDSAATATPV